MLTVFPVVADIDVRSHNTLPGQGGSTRVVAITPVASAG